MGGGGKDDKYREEQFSVDISTVRILPDDRLYNALVYQAIEKTTVEEYEPPMTITGIGKAGFYSLQTYYNWSSWTAPYSFPVCSLNTIEIPEEQLRSIIAAQYSVTPEELEDFYPQWKVESNAVWYKYMLQERYGYSIGKSYILLEDEWFYIQDYTVTNIITINLLNVPSCTTSHYLDTTVSVFFNEDIQKDVVVTTVEKVIEVVDDNRGAVIDKDITTVSITEEEVEFDTVDPSVIRIEESTETVEQTIAVPTITVPVAPANYAYSVQFRVEGILYYWIYYPLLGTNTSIGQVNIPTLGVPVAGTETIKMFPMTVLRHNHFSINEYDGPNTKKLPAGDDTYTVVRTDAVTEEKYEDTEWVLQGLGLPLDDILNTIDENPDVDKIADAILCLAVEPTDDHPIVSKVLFETFREFIVSTEALVPKTVTITRDPFNIGVSWQRVLVSTEEDVIGDKGTYTHSLKKVILEEPVAPTCPIKAPSYAPSYWAPTKACQAEWNHYYSELQFYNNNNKKQQLTLRYQVTETIVETYVIIGLNSVTLIGRSIQETTEDRVQSESFLLPLPVAVVNKLSFMEQVDLIERSLRLVFYAAQLYVQELAWYETGVFKALITVIVFIISVVVSYFTGPQNMTWSMAIIQGIQGLALAVAVSLVINAIATVVDIPFIKEILMVIKIAIQLYMGYIDLTDAYDLLLTAVDLVNIGLSITTGIINLDTLSVQEDRYELAQDYQEKSEEFEDIFKEMNEGLSTEDIVDLTNSDRLVLVPPAQYYEGVYNTLYSYDLLFNNSYDNVNEFYSNSYDLT